MFPIFTVTKLPLISMSYHHVNFSNLLEDSILQINHYQFYLHSIQFHSVLQEWWRIQELGNTKVNFYVPRRSDRVHRVWINNEDTLRCVVHAEESGIHLWGSSWWPCPGQVMLGPDFEEWVTLAGRPEMEGSVTRIAPHTKCDTSEESFSQLEFRVLASAAHIQLEFRNRV